MVVAQYPIGGNQYIMYAHTLRMVEQAGTDGQPAFPKFGAVQDRTWRFDEYGLDVEMYWCYRSHYRECQEVRILHASTYRPGAWPEILKIIQYMNGEGFRVEYKPYGGREFHQEWSTADVLLLGCDSKQAARVRGAMDEMERGLHGVLREWDVLWYFADGRVPREARLHMGGSGLCAGDRFSAEGIRMVRAHIRRRHDTTAQRGLYVTQEQWIVDGIDRIIPPDPEWDNFGQKVNLLKKCIGTDGRDRDLFFAVTEFLMEVRNRSSHPKVSSSFDNRMASYQELKAKARLYGIDLGSFLGHGCPMRQDGEPSHQDRHVGRRSSVAWARMAIAWLNDHYATLLERSRQAGAGPTIRQQPTGH